MVLNFLFKIRLLIRFELLSPITMYDFFRNGQIKTYLQESNSIVNSIDFLKTPVFFLIGGLVVSFIIYLYRIIFKEYNTDNERTNNHLCIVIMRLVQTYFVYLCIYVA